MSRGYYVPCAPFLYLVPDSGGMDCMPLQPAHAHQPHRPPGPFQYLMHEQAKSLVALQELQNEVGALLEFRDLVMETFPHLRQKLAASERGGSSSSCCTSTASSTAPTLPPAPAHLHHAAPGAASAAPGRRQRAAAALPRDARLADLPHARRSCRRRRRRRRRQRHRRAARRRLPRLRHQHQVRVPVRGQRGTAGGAAAARDVADRRGHRHDEVRGRQVVLGRPAAVRVHDAAVGAAALALRPGGAPAGRRRRRRRGGGAVRLEPAPAARLARPGRAGAAAAGVRGAADGGVRARAPARLLGRHAGLHAARARGRALHLRLPHLPRLPGARRAAAAAPAGRPAAPAARLPGSPGQLRDALRARGRGRRPRRPQQRPGSLQEGGGGVRGARRRRLHGALPPPRLQGCTV